MVRAVDLKPLDLWFQKFENVENRLAAPAKLIYEKEITSKYAVYRLELFGQAAYFKIDKNLNLNTFSWVSQGITKTVRN